MKERRKIFNAADVAAIRDGRKTMFREMVAPQRQRTTTIGSTQKVRSAEGLRLE